MDPITHSLTGYVISNVLYKDKYKESKAYFKAFGTATILGAVAPDIDFVTRFVGGDTFYFINHRTITHSPVGVLILSLLCALIAKLMRRESKFTILFIGALGGGISHVLLDITNVYSTLALWPFSDKMYSLGVLSIIDLFILGLYVLSVLLSRLKPLKVHKRAIFSTVLIVILCYTGVKFYIQGSLKSYITDQYKKGAITEGVVNPSDIERISVMTDFIGVNRWNFIIENSDEYIKGTAAFSSRSLSNITPVKKKEMDKAVESAAETPLGQFVLKFSPYVDYAVEKYNEGYIVRLVDLRSTFSVSLREGDGSKYSHAFGGYIVLDSQFRPTYWSIRNPLEQDSEVVAK